MRTTICGAAVIALAVALVGCNLVYSERPLFSAADAKNGPGLRIGLWLKRDAGCQFDETRPVRRWPKCAEWQLVRPTDVLGLDAQGRKWTQYGYVLAAGQPRILQVAVQDPQVDGGRAEYFYLGLDPIRIDPNGDVVEYRDWLVQCGPPPPTPPPEGKHPKLVEPQVTQAPLPGLVPHPDADHPDDCSAQTAVAVRNAAQASLAWSSTDNWRWVRSGGD